jgi:hypothetical protein
VERRPAEEREERGREEHEIGQCHGEEGRKREGESEREREGRRKYDC